MKVTIPPQTNSILTESHEAIEAAIKAIEYLATEINTGSVPDVGMELQINNIVKLSNTIKTLMNLNILINKGIK